MTAQLLAKHQQLQPTKRSKGKRILLVEDNNVNRMLLSDYLGYCKYNVKDLPDGDAFFPTVYQFQPDLILLDLKLPGIDGYFLLEEIKKKPDLSNIPIIIVSGLAFKADREEAMKLGASRYFVKPLNLNDLVLAIEEELAFCPI
ncbi:MAG: response regulator [Nostocaceae cyanobacterium]|nr:response regulator [Nostocaceae cyanobacterium]